MVAGCVTGCLAQAELGCSLLSVSLTRSLHVDSCVDHGTGLRTATWWAAGGLLMILCYCRKARNPSISLNRLQHHPFWRMVLPMCQISHERKEVAGKTRFANNVHKAVCSGVSLTDTEANVSDQYYASTERWSASLLNHLLSNSSFRPKGLSLWGH